MKKDYQKPEMELITLVTEEAITNDGIPDGGTGTTSNPFGF